MMERKKIEQRPIDVVILGCLNIFGLGSAFTCLCRRYCKRRTLCIEFSFGGFVKLNNVHSHTNSAPIFFHLFDICCQARSPQENRGICGWQSRVA